VLTIGDNRKLERVEVVGEAGFSGHDKAP